MYNSQLQQEIPSEGVRGASSTRTRVLTISSERNFYFHLLIHFVTVLVSYTNLSKADLVQNLGGEEGNVTKVLVINQIKKFIYKKREKTKKKNECDLDGTVLFGSLGDAP